MGIPHPQAWVQIAAVSREQTKNTVALLPTLMSEKLKATYGIKPGEELIRANGGKQRLEAVTSNYRSLEGARSTFVVLNETHHWIESNGGHKMYETADGNTTKKNSRYLAITNAYLPGEDSVAERMRLAWEQLIEQGTNIGFLYDSIEAHPSTPLTPEAMRIVLPKIRGDAVWLDVETIIQSILDPTLSASRSRRMWLNMIVADEDALHDAESWDTLILKDALLKPGDPIVMGFDGGSTDDSTALVAIRTTDLCVFLLHLQEKPHNWPTGREAPKWEVDRTRVDSAVHEAFRVYDVKGFYADVYPWESYITDWSEKYGDRLAVRSQTHAPIGWDMRSSLQRSTLAHERLLRSIFDKKLHHDGNRSVRRHVMNARRRENNYGVSFGKESRESSRKVDIYAALMLAHECLYDLRSRGKQPKQRTGRGYFL